jgi:hypothetical protein
MKETRRAFYLRMIAEQKQWIRSCGGTLDGYTQNYGAADDPNRTGNGGEAIYQADTQALANFEHRLEQLGPVGGKWVGPDYRIVVKYLVHCTNPACPSKGQRYEVSSVPVRCAHCKSESWIKEGI